jgi:hypothetical protein
MAFNYDHVSEKRLYCGMTGSGKTQMAMRFVCESDYRYYFIFDHDGQFANRNKLRNSYSPQQIAAQLKTQRFVIFNPCEMFGDCRGDKNVEKRRGAFDWFCAYVFQVSEKIPQKLDGKKLLYADEVQDICTVSKIGMHAQQCITSGRNRSLDFVGATVQINLVNHSVRAGFSHLYAFRQNEENAVADLVALGFNAKELWSLPEGSYVMRDIRGNEFRGQVPGWRSL